MLDNYRKALEHPNVRAFLRVIRHGESSQDQSAYRWLFGSTPSNPKLFDSFAAHPRVKTYEKYDGQFIKNGKLDYTTAAGAYQIVGSTWDECVEALGLPDFSPESQDLAAVYLIDRRHALGDLLEGRVTDSINKLGQEWASLPSAKYGQPIVKLEEALKVYQAYGGTTGPGPAELPPVLVPPETPPQEQWQSDDPAQHSQEANAMPIPVLAPLAGSLLMGLANSLIEVFTPLAKEKITKEMARHTDKPEVAEQIATTLIESAKTLTGKTNPVAAVAAAQENPAIMAKVEVNALADLDKLLPVLDKLSSLDSEAWRAEEESRRNADERAQLAEFDQDQFLTRSIIFLLVGLLVALMVLIGIMQWLKADSGTVGTLIGLFAAAGGAVTAKFGTRYDHRYGSSRGSAASGAIVAELARRR